MLFGLACGDALGRPVEFKSSEWITEHHGTLDEMVGDGSHRQPAGTITDDTQQALRIARSLVENRAFDPDDIAERLVEWYLDDPFDIGMMTAEVLGAIDRGYSWGDASRMIYSRKREGHNAGNGSAMRVAPLAVAYLHAPDRLIEVSRTASEITHYDLRCQYGCAILNFTIANCIKGHEDPLGDAIERMPADCPDELISALEPVPDRIDESELDNGGFVVTTLQAALYHGLTASDAETAIVNAVNMGMDTDTIGAITGAIAGARHGIDSIPERWVKGLQGTDEYELDVLSNQLFNLEFQ
ncbi:MAG: ADP-ribosylglycohydrolase family protein [Halobacteriales archaeon]